MSKRKCCSHVATARLYHSFIMCLSDIKGTLTSACVQATRNLRSLRICLRQSGTLFSNRFSFFRSQSEKNEKRHNIGKYHAAAGYESHRRGINVLVLIKDYFAQER